MGADAIMVQFALLSAMALRFAYYIAFERAQTEADIAHIFWRDVHHYSESAWPLTLICLCIFYLSGFYTYGRAYQGRYKALIVAQAVSQSYLIFGFLSYFGRGELPLSRSALLAAWMLSVVILVASRIWSSLWNRLVHSELEAQRAIGRDGVVLVVGGAGYIGSALVPKLLAKGRRVRVLDLLLYGTEPIEKVLGHPSLEVIPGDFRHVEKVVEAMQGVGAVVHLGAIVGDPACDLNEQLTIDVNLTATRMIAQVAKGAGVRRFVFASTCSVYGASNETLDERSKVSPISLYGRTKLAAERGLERMADDEFAPTIVRFATIYGLSGRTRMDLVVNKLTAMAKTDGKITIFGGDQWRPFVHVDDAAAAIEALLDAPPEIVGNEIFNVGSDDQNYTINEIGELIHQHVPAAELSINEASADRRNYRVSFRKIRQMIGYRPAWTVEAGIQQVLEAIASGDITDHRDARYSNVEFLSRTGGERLVQADDDWTQELSPRSPSESSA